MGPPLPKSLAQQRGLSSQASGCRFWVRAASGSVCGTKNTRLSVFSCKHIHDLRLLPHSHRMGNILQAALCKQWNNTHGQWECSHSRADPVFWSRRPSGVLTPGGLNPKLLKIGASKLHDFEKNLGGKEGPGSQGLPGSARVSLQDVSQTHATRSGITWTHDAGDCART